MDFRLITSIISMGYNETKTMSNPVYYQGAPECNAPIFEISKLDVANLGTVSWLV